MPFVLIAGVYCVESPISMFSRVGNVINIFKQTAINGILATGMACAILVGGV